MAESTKEPLLNQSPEDGRRRSSSSYSDVEQDSTSRNSPRSAKTRRGLCRRICTLIILVLSASANVYSGIGLATQRGFDLDEDRDCVKLGSGALPLYKGGSGKESRIEAVVYDGSFFPVCGDKNHTNPSALDYR